MIFLIILLILAIGGRLACSTICPLGVIQELIFEIPYSKKFVELPYEKYLKKIKYIIFILLLILVPMSVMQNKSIFGDFKIFVKLFGFGTVFLMSIFAFRPFCKYFCPFGVFLGLFNKISPFRYKVDSSCNKCRLCRKKCKMGIKPYENPNSVECIRCGECINKCAKKSIHK